MVEPERLQIAIWLRVACWISKTTRAQAHARSRAPTIPHSLKHAVTHARTRPHTHTHTHTYLSYLLLFHGNSCYVNSPQCYVICTSPLLQIRLFESIAKRYHSVFPRLVTASNSESWLHNFFCNQQYSFYI